MQPAVRRSLLFAGAMVVVLAIFGAGYYTGRSATGRYALVVVDQPGRHLCRIDTLTGETWQSRSIGGEIEWNPVKEESWCLPGDQSR